ncbi:RDD family protein [Anatilimnocola floriformis]|uniref:RDD family protein n=1 Tax=Anatilimnocola floriformis TaxID=2948575 RepID=UPI0020C3F1B5|nr:RDD family protein [Anatilimnocola floriformis]
MPAYVDRSLGDGVFYAPGDYIGFWPRIVILLVDGLALTIGLIMVGMVSQLIFPPLYSLLAIVFIWVFEVPLKRSRFRTPGYWLMGCKIVNLRGERPSLFLLTMRAIMPFYISWDLVWSGIDEDRQSLRDRYSKTCLVRVKAEPIGSGPVQFSRYFAGGLALFYPYVVRPSRNCCGISAGQLSI